MVHQDLSLSWYPRHSRMFILIVDAVYYSRGAVHEISEEDLERTQYLLEIGSCRPLSQCCLCLEFSIAN